MSTPATTPLIEELDHFVARSRAPRLRNMRQFAEEEIVLPNGPFAGRRFTVERQPYTGLFLDAVDSGRWNRIFVTGPTQSGKTLIGSVLPVLYHLFEVGEAVIFGLPDMDMAGDKWALDLLPVIERTKYRDLLPRSGAGSRGGRVDRLVFRNGAVLKFMSGGGGDKSRAGFTARVLVLTEVDGMDTAGGGSREADKVAQMEARTRAFGDRKRVYGECTVSIIEGRTWQEYTKGTRSRIVLPCPICRAWVTLEREHLLGWREAGTALAAEKEAAFYCPGCGAAWSEGNRTQANMGARLIHRGQDLGEEGGTTGPVPETRTLGFRWSAVNNLFVTAGDIGAEEWRAERAGNQDNAEKEMSQFVWAVPYSPAIEEMRPLDSRVLLERQGGGKRGEVPAWARRATVGCDIGMRMCHWMLIAWAEGGRGHVVDYGVIEVASDEMGVERALMAALRTFRDEAILPGWPGGVAGRMRPSFSVFDSRYEGPVVRAFCKESGAGFFPTIGFGATQGHGQTRSYHHPRSRGRAVLQIGEGYHIVRTAPDFVKVINVNADHWKSWVHNRLMAAADAADALTLFQVLHSRDHLALIKHLTAERQTQEFIAGRGLVTRWEQVSRNNHWFDAAALASMAGHLAGVRLIGTEPVKGETEKKQWFNRRT